MELWSNATWNPPPFCEPSSAARLRSWKLHFPEALAAEVLEANEAPLMRYIQVKFRGTRATVTSSSTASSVEAMEILQGDSWVQHSRV